MAIDQFLEVLEHLIDPKLAIDEELNAIFMRIYSVALFLDPFGQPSQGIVHESL
jgi:hypothetical protein